LSGGRAWFADIAIGRSLQTGIESSGFTTPEALRLTGGYRWDDGQSVSLQITGSRGGGGLGLSLNYDWPRYFVRLSHENRIDLLPQKRLRLSAGMRF